MFPGIDFDRPELYAKQKAAVYEPKRLSLIEASTKAGKTVACIIWLAEQAAAGRAGWNYWWVAPVTDQASIAFRRMCDGLPQGQFTAALSHPQHIRLINGTTIWFKSADKPNSLYGEDVYAAVVDEASRSKPDAWIALRSTLTYTEGPCRIIGNVHGRKNWFYQLARRAQHAQELSPDGDPEMAYHKITAHDAVEAGVLSAKEIEDAKSVMPEADWRELFMAEAADDGGNPFGVKYIAACVGPDNMALGPPVCWGWDLAKRQDYTVGIALDNLGQVCRFERFQNIPWDEILNRIVLESKNVPALVDSTGVGDPILDFLQKKPGTRFEGYHFTPSSKQRLMEGLAVAIQSQKIRYTNGPIRTELESFEYEFTRTSVRYSAPEGMNDDCVCALALAVMCKTVVPPPLNITEQTLMDISRMPKRRIVGY